MISPKQVQEILEATRIEEVVEDFVRLRRRGANLIGNCPFHSEKTPSFNVSPAKGIFKCFGCGKAGDAVTFLKEHEQYNYVESLRWLAKKYNISIEEVEVSKETQERFKEEDSLFIVNEFAAKHFRTNLLETDLGKSLGLSYFENRGFSLETIEKFGLGFSMSENDDLTTHATKAGFSLAQLQKLGLSNSYGKDFFRERVMFPIYNASGKISAFGGRIMNSQISTAKYINSPETEIYHKSDSLYGLFQAKKAIRTEDEVILVEGYTDVISLYQNGIQNVVSSSGTALTEGQAALIKRYASKVCLFYDGDAAGIKAAVRGLDILIAKDLDLRVVILPDGEDPDSFVKKLGKDGVLDFISTTGKDFILFKLDALISENGGNPEKPFTDPIKKVIIARGILQTIALMPDALKRGIYLQEIASKISLDISDLNRELEKYVKKNSEKKYSKFTDSPDSNPQPGDNQLEEIQNESVAFKESTEFQEKDLARILIVFGSKPYEERADYFIANLILENVADLQAEIRDTLFIKVLKETSSEINHGRVPVPNFFLHHPDEMLRKAAADFLMEEHLLSPGWEERNVFLQNQKIPDLNFDRDAISSLMRFRLKKLDALCKRQKNSISQIENSGSSDDELFKAIRIYQELIRHRDEVAKELGTVVI
jgi:DNA primase